MLVGYMRVSNSGDSQALDLGRGKPHRCRPGRRRHTGYFFSRQAAIGVCTRDDYRLGQSAEFNTKASRTRALLS